MRKDDPWAGINEATDCHACGQALQAGQARCLHCGAWRNQAPPGVRERRASGDRPVALAAAPAAAAPTREPPPVAASAPAPVETRRQCPKCRRRFTADVIRCPSCLVITTLYDPSTAPAVSAPVQAAPTEAPVRCPKCSSQQLTPFKKGFSVGKAAAGALLLGPLGLLGGGIGAGKVELVCMKCGHRFAPGR